MHKERRSGFSSHLDQEIPRATTEEIAEAKETKTCPRCDAPLDLATFGATCPDCPFTF